MAHWVPSLRGLRAFEAAGRHLSFTKAAQDLGLTQAAVSYRIAELEKNLGLQLFQRGGRSLELTSEGRVYLPIVLDALHRLENGTAELIDRRRTGNKVIRVLTMQAFASLWLVPHLHRFRAQYPDIEVQIISGIGGVSQISPLALEQQEIDAAILLTSSQAQFGELDVCAIAEDFALPVVAPELIGPEDRIGCPDSLTRLHVLHALTWPDIWRRWLHEAGHPGLQFHAEMHLQNTGLTTQAAMSGLGVAMAHAPLVTQFISSGALVAPFEFRLATNCSYFLASQKHSPVKERLVLFRDWVAAEMAHCGVPSSEPESEHRTAAPR